jgi:serine/threonine protein kinase
MGCTHSAPLAGAPEQQQQEAVDGSPAADAASAAKAATATPSCKARSPTACAVVALVGRARKTIDGVGGGAGATNNNTTPNPNPNPNPNAADNNSKKTAAAAAKKNLPPSADVLGRGAKDDVRTLFTFGRVLGKGQFGTTRVVTDNKTGEQHACKVIPKRKLVGKEDAEDVRREVRVLHHLSGHPHVVGFRGAYEDDTAVYIIMELCKGGELFDAVARRGHFREREAARCVATLLSVVEHCHGMCVALRDLKPENVLFLHEAGGGAAGGGGPAAGGAAGAAAGGAAAGGANGGSNGSSSAGGGFCDAAPLGPGWPRHLKVIDFGLSCFVSATDPAPLSELVGSPFYMAPEVLRRVSLGGALRVAA